MEIHVSQIAKEEIESIYKYIFAHSSNFIAQKQIQKIKRDIARLETAPNIGVNIGNDFKKLVVRPYIVIYQINGSTIQIARIFDGRQDWQKIVFAK